MWLINYYNFALEYTIMDGNFGDWTIPTFYGSLFKTVYVTKDTWYYIEVDVMLTNRESPDKYLDILSDDIYEGR